MKRIIYSYGRWRRHSFPYGKQVQTERVGFDIEKGYKMLQMMDNASEKVDLVITLVSSS